MRILVVAQTRMEKSGGGGAHLEALCRTWTDLGHQVMLIAPGAQERMLGVLGPKPPPFFRPGVRMELMLSALLPRAVRRFRPQVAYVRLSASGALVSHALTALGIPVVLELNGLILQELRNAGRSERAISMVRTHLRWSVRRAAAFVAVTEEIADHAREEFGASTVVIENGADLSVAKPGDQEQAQARQGLQKGRQHLVFVGTLAKEQRFDLLFSAHRRLKDVTLTLVGDGPDREKVKARAQEKTPDTPVMWRGRRSHSEAVDFIRASDVGVDVRPDHLSMKCMEYAAVGCRQVLFRTRGTARLESLFPVSVGAIHVAESVSADGVYRAVESSLRAARELGSMPLEVIEAARQEIGWEQTATRLLRLFDELS